MKSTHLDAYEMHLTLLEKRINEAAKVMSTWERWIPKAEREELDGRVKDLKALNGNLELRKAEFVTAQRISKDALAAGASGPEAVRAHPPPAKPIVRMDQSHCPTSQAAKENTTDGRKTGRAFKNRESRLAQPRSRKFNSWTAWMTRLGRISGSQPTTLQRICSESLTTGMEINQPLP